MKNFHYSHSLPLNTINIFFYYTVHNKKDEDYTTLINYRIHNNRFQMPSPTAFKSKWNNLVTKLSPTICKHDNRRLSSQSDEGIRYNSQKERKLSDATSVGTYDSNTTMANKFRQALPFFRRRSSSTSNSSQSTCVQPLSIDHLKTKQKLDTQYLFALDEFHYAEDSEGSSYYSGDYESAREALVECLKTFSQLLQMITDPATRESIESTMAPKIDELRRRFYALPVPIETGY
ncbi:hypothetical protein BDB01DRAFT_812653 [Pilobolus umbonatus]|nr:hypothetical protein BDB01DRAFT_812653 [Pilobolus umbonatus]